MQAAAGLEAGAKQQPNENHCCVTRKKKQETEKYNKEIKMTRDNISWLTPLPSK